MNIDEETQPIGRDQIISVVPLRMTFQIGGFSVHVGKPPIPLRGEYDLVDRSRKQFFKFLEQQPNPGAAKFSTLPDHGRGSTQSVNPPRHARIALRLLVSRDKLEDLLGQLEEDFHKNAQAEGARVAQSLYWWEVIKTCCSYIIPALSRLAAVANLLRKLGQ